MSTWLLFRGALRDLLRPRSLLTAVPLAALPALLALLWRAAAGAAEFDAAAAYNTLSGGLVFGFILVILSVLFGTAVVSRELEGGTIVYLLTRPVPRARILAAKFLGAWTGITAMVWLSTLLLAAAAFGPLSLAKEVVRQDLLVLPLGAMAYGSLFLLAGAGLNRPLVYGLFFTFGWESWVPVMPGVFHRLAIMTYLRALAPHPNLLDEEDDFSDLMEIVTTADIAPGTAWAVLLLFSLAALGAALAVFARREYLPREDAE